MEIRKIKSLILIGLAGAVIASGSAQGQTYVAITNLLFSENFSSYAVGTLPTTEAAGGLWGSIAWPGTNGSASVVADDQNLFGQGAQNQFFRAASTRDLFLTTPTFFPQEVAIFEFDFIGHYPAGDGTRWLNVDLRAGGLTAHITGLRIYDAVIRTAATDVPREPSYGGNDKAIRVWTVMNNKLQDILYDAPDGSGTLTLSATNASVWLYHYETTTWEHVIPKFVYARNASAVAGFALDTLRFYLDNNAALRSYDLDNVKVYGARALAPTIHVAITNLLFKDDFNSYTAGGMPTTTADGGKWGTATWKGTTGTATMAEDINNIFGLGEANLYFQLSNTHNLNPGLTTPVFNPKQEVITYAFDFVGHFYDNDLSRWVNIDARNASGAAHTTSLLMSNTSIRGAPTPAPSYGPNGSMVRILTVLNNRLGNITYDRPDGSGPATLGALKASLWIRAAGYGWENIVPEYIYSRMAETPTTPAFPSGAEIDRVRFFMDSNAQWRSFDMDNVEVYGSIKPIPLPVNLSATIADGKVQVRWMGTESSAYQVQYRTHLNAGDWMNLGTPIVATATGQQVFEEALSEDARFYRVEQVLE